LSLHDALPICSDAEPHGQIFVDRENFVVIVGLDENEADEDARDDGAEGELDVSVIAQRIAFARCSKKSAGARFRRDDGSEHGPPRDLPATEREILEVALLAPHAQADENDGEKISE